MKNFMPDPPDDVTVDHQKLYHDFRNDIVSLKMNLEAIKLSRDEPDTHQELVEMMLDSVKTLDQRIGQTMKLLIDNDSKTNSKS